jgi:hypothetical protein
MVNVNKIKNIKIYHTICNVCGEDLGEERIYWAEEHLKKISRSFEL